jgi:hypothetical protein
MSKTTKFLIETSATPAATAFSTNEHCAHFQGKFEGEELWTSTYIRMEFIRVWICAFANVAATIALSENVSDALVVLEQDFSPRKVKAALRVVASLLRQNGMMNNSRAAAEEVASFGINLLNRFDKIFARRVTNVCKCQIGNREAPKDFNNCVSQLAAFASDFATPITDCEVNDFLQLSKRNGRAAKLLADPQVVKLKASKGLAAFHSEGTWITCKECSKIGDVLISLEQPKHNNLVHVDASFDVLCPSQAKPHTLLKSVLAVRKESTPTPDAPAPLP